jgi:hypothetical protein
MAASLSLLFVPFWRMRCNPLSRLLVLPAAAVPANTRPSGVTTEASWCLFRACHLDVKIGFLGWHEGSALRVLPASPSTFFHVKRASRDSGLTVGTGPNPRPWHDDQVWGQPLRSVPAIFKHALQLSSELRQLHQMPPAVLLIGRPEVALAYPS